MPKPWCSEAVPRRRRESSVARVTVADSLDVEILVIAALTAACSFGMGIAYRRLFANVLRETPEIVSAADVIRFQRAWRRATLWMLSSLPLIVLIVFGSIVASKASDALMCLFLVLMGFVVWNLFSAERAAKGLIVSDDLLNDAYRQVCNGRLADLYELPPALKDLEGKVGGLSVAADAREGCLSPPDRTRE